MKELKLISIMQSFNPNIINDRNPNKLLLPLS